MAHKYKKQRIRWRIFSTEMNYRSKSVG